MITKIYHIKANNEPRRIISEAAKCLINGGLVAFPTETVYGIGANALSDEAVKKIYIAKGRPSDNPLIAHIHDIKEVGKYAVDIPPVAYKIMDKFWPGPLTIIFKRSNLISDTITGGLNTIALRIPSNEIARQLIAEANIPIAAPSANISGRPSPTDVNHVIEDLEGKVDIIIDGGPTDIGLESTVLDVTTTIPTILRPGKITKNMLEAVIGEVRLDDALTISDHNIIPRAPGMKYKHYAPKGRLILVEGEEDLSIKQINKWVKEKEASGHKVAIISTSENVDQYQCHIVKIIGSKDNHDQIAANLFAILRQMDEENIEFIYTRAFIEEDIGFATMNRLTKAAGNKKVLID